MVINNKGLVVYIVGICFDMFTTIVGQFKGFQELHPSGFISVYIVNFLLLATVCMVAHWKKDEFANNKWVQTSIGIVGLSRIIIGFMNIYTISMLG